LKGGGSRCGKPSGHYPFDRPQPRQAYAIHQRRRQRGKLAARYRLGGAGRPGNDDGDLHAGKNLVRTCSQGDGEGACSLAAGHCRLARHATGSIRHRHHSRTARNRNCIGAIVRTLGGSARTRPERLCGNRTAIPSRGGFWNQRITPGRFRQHARTRMHRKRALRPKFAHLLFRGRDWVVNIRQAATISTRISRETDTGERSRETG
jgi:hypothetical protein